MLFWDLEYPSVIKHISLVHPESACYCISELDWVIDGVCRGASGGVRSLDRIGILHDVDHLDP